MPWRDEKHHAPRSSKIITPSPYKNRLHISGSFVLSLSTVNPTDLPWHTTQESPENRAIIRCRTHPRMAG